MSLFSTLGPNLRKEGCDCGPQFKGIQSTRTRHGSRSGRRLVSLYQQSGKREQTRRGNTTEYQALSPGTYFLQQVSTSLVKFHSSDTSPKLGVKGWNTNPFGDTWRSTSTLVGGWDVPRENRMSRDRGMGENGSSSQKTVRTALLWTHATLETRTWLPGTVISPSLKTVKCSLPWRHHTWCWWNCCWAKSRSRPCCAHI